MTFAFSPAVFLTDNISLSFFCMRIFQIVFVVAASATRQMALTPTPQSLPTDAACVPTAILI